MNNKGVYFNPTFDECVQIAKEWDNLRIAFAPDGVMIANGLHHVHSSELRAARELYRKIGMKVVGPGHVYVLHKKGSIVYFEPPLQNVPECLQDIIKLSDCRLSYE